MAVPAADLYRAARDRLAVGEPVAMTSVVATRGSTPQKAGARMLIFSDGQTLGTIGGGCIEAEVWAEARKLIKRQHSELREFVLADDPDQPGGDVCGGTMEVFIDVLKPATPGPMIDMAGRIRVEGLDVTRVVGRTRAPEPGA